VNRPIYHAALAPFNPRVTGEVRVPTLSLAESGRARLNATLSCPFKRGPLLS